jgi:hypothetical protein
MKKIIAHNCSQLLEHVPFTFISLQIHGRVADCGMLRAANGPMNMQYSLPYCRQCRSFLPIFAMAILQSALFRDSTINSGNLPHSGSLSNSPLPGQLSNSSAAGQPGTQA